MQPLTFDTESLVSRILAAAAEGEQEIEAARV